MERKMKSCIILILIFSTFQNISAIDNFDILFNESQSQLINITISYAQIEGIVFNITGSIYNSSYPSNITLDFTNNQEFEWSYIVYHSNISFEATKINNLWSNNPDSSEIYFMSNMSNTNDGVSLGKIQNKIFKKISNILKGNLSITTIDTLNKQIISVITNTTTIHTFIPNIIATGGQIGLYIAKGGSTYYCNSDHTFDLTTGCNLSISQALTPTHLAREANQTGFKFTEKINNPKITQNINSYLENCSLPCNITINITSKTPGNITLSNFQIIGPGEPPNISITQNSTHYSVNITSTYNLTRTRYFYGTMPSAYFIPMIASDDTQILTTNQSLRLNMLKDTITESWDNLTNFSHPINFTHFMTPVIIPDYTISENDSSNFTLKARDTALTQITSKTPTILIILDIHDYFPKKEDSNSRTTIDNDNLISQIYINGFSDNNPKTLKYNYNNSTLKNLVLHELAHTFIFYPTKEKLFYEDHPSSFSKLENSTTYNINESKTGNEGYYEIYSILNQIRPFIADSDLNNIPPRLSPLDKMLLGILSPYISENYTFYSTNITKLTNRYLITNITPEIDENVKELYDYSDDDSWWNIKTDSQSIEIENSSQFQILKTNQNNRSLWIFAEDIAHPNHFKVFNSNSNSIKTIKEPMPIIYLISPENSETINQRNITLKCKAYNNIKNITLYTNITGTWNNTYTNSTGSDISYTFKNLSDGTYKWNCLAYNKNNQSNWANNQTFSIFNLSKLLFALNWSEWNKNETTNFSQFNNTQLENLSDVQFVNSEGKIEFLRELNLNRDLDLSNKIKILKHKIWINSTLIPEFNKSARLTFKNVTLDLPIIKKDNSDCPSTICQNSNFNSTSKEYIFSVTSFSEYSLEEQCSDGVQNYNEAGIDCGGSCGQCSSKESSQPSSGGGGTSSTNNQILKKENITNSLPTKGNQNLNTGNTIKNEETINLKKDKNEMKEKINENSPLKKIFATTIILLMLAIITTLTIRLYKKHLFHQKIQSLIKEIKTKADFPNNSK